jgi:hypothetical protein
MPRKPKWQIELDQLAPPMTDEELFRTATAPRSRARTVSYQGKTTCVMTDRRAIPGTTRRTARRGRSRGG